MHRPMTRAADMPWARALIAAVLLGLFYRYQAPLAFWSFGELARAMGLHLMTPDHTLASGPFLVMALSRLLIVGLLFVVICAVMGISPGGFPLREKRPWRWLATGFLIGLVVMVAAILGMLLGDSRVAASKEPVGFLASHGAQWVLCNLVISAAEELEGRGALLLVVTRLFGWRVAVLVSGVMFAYLHLDNPGASAIWLVRLGVQGALLAYAVFRTGSIWWSIGYHAGWNWASAPLFGALGSGYLDQGHLFTFYPRGSAWLTGGEVGPEGSVLACVAVAVAAGLLIWSSRQRAPQALAVPVWKV